MGEEAVSQKPIPLWRNHDYLLLWLGQAVSSLGTGISQLAFPLLILALTHSPAAAGFAAALECLPYVLFSLPAGALVDRWDRKRIMIICTLGLGLSIASIVVALATGRLTILHLYLVSLFVGTFGIFYELAELGALAHVASKAQLPAAVAQNEAVYSTVSLLAPSLSGLLFSMGRLFPFVADVVSYLVLFVSLLRIRNPLQRERDIAMRHLLAEVREGIRWLWSRPVLRALAFLTGYFYVLMNGSVLIVLVVAQQHQVSPGIIGLIFALGGVGNIIGTLLSMPIQRRVRFGWAINGVLIVFVLLWPLYSLASTPVFLGLIVAGLALVDSIASILMASYRLTTTPDELQGRVGGVYRLVIFGSLALGQALIGVCLQQFGVTVTVGILWAGLILCSIGMLANPRVRGANLPHEE